MDYATQQEINRKVLSAVEAGDRAKNLMEAVARRHAELDQKLSILNDRLARIEEILAPQLEAKNKVQVGENPQKKGFFSRLVGG